MKDVKDTRYRLTLSRSKGVAYSQVVAYTSDPLLVRQVVAGLHRNWILEDDNKDRVVEAGFIASAPAAVAALDDHIRRKGQRAGSGEDAQGSGPQAHRTPEDSPP